MKKHKNIAKLWNVALLISSMVGYLEWRPDQKSFLIQMEWEILKRAADDFWSVLHPFVVLLIIGQLLLIVGLIQQKPNKWLLLVGVGCIGLLMAMILLVGVLSKEIKIIASALPFTIVAVMAVRNAFMENKGAD